MFVYALNIKKLHVFIGFDMRSILLLLAMVSTHSAFANLIDGTLRIDQPLEIHLPERLKNIQRSDFYEEFSTSFKTFGDLRPDTVDRFLRDNPEYFQATMKYLHTIFKARHITASQFLNLRNTGVDAVQQVELNDPPAIVHQQLSTVPSDVKTSKVPSFVKSKREEPKWQGVLVASRNDAPFESLVREELPTIKTPSKMTKLEVEETTKRIDDEQSIPEPHRFALFLNSGQTTGHYFNISTPRESPYENAVSQGFGFETYIPSGFHDQITLLLQGNHERVNFDVGSNTGVERKFGYWATLLALGRSDVTSGTGEELGLGFKRDYRSNKSYILSSRFGLGDGWSIFGHYEDQYATDRWLYSSRDGWYQEPEGVEMLLGLTKYVGNGLAVSIAYSEADMGADNGDSYDLSTWETELGYYF